MSGFTSSCILSGLIAAEGGEEGQVSAHKNTVWKCLVSGRYGSGQLPTLHVADDERRT